MRSPIFLSPYHDIDKMMTDPKQIESETSAEKSSRMTFTGHLTELRTRLIRSAIAVGAGFLVCYIFSNTIIDALSYPLSGLQDSTVVVAEEGEEGSTFQAGEISWVVLTPLEPILVKIKIAMYFGILLASPYLIYHVCGFIFPGLTEAERKIGRILIIGSTGLAMAGVAVAYWAVFPFVLPYLVTFVPDYVEITLRLNETLSLIIKGILGFAIAFQFPMVVLILVYLGLLTPETLKQYRRVAIVGMFAGSALLTPPDPMSMIIMAMPLIMLYEVSILLSHIVIRRKKAAEEA